MWKEKGGVENNNKDKSNAMIYLFLQHAFEEVEALSSVDVLRRAGKKVTTVSMMSTKQVESSHGVRIEADMLFEEVDFDNAEALIIPGGMPAAADLSEHAELRKLLQQKAPTSTLLCAICAGPMVLGKAGLLDGKKATVYPGFEKYLIGAECTGHLVEIDGNIITGRGPAAGFPFAFAILEQLDNKQVADDLRRVMQFD